MPFITEPWTFSRDENHVRMEAKFEDDLKRVAPELLKNLRFYKEVGYEHLIEEDSIKISANIRVRVEGNVIYILS